MMCWKACAVIYTDYPSYSRGLRQEDHKVEAKVENFTSSLRKPVQISASLANLYGCCVLVGASDCENFINGLLKPGVAE